jgi:hypothetical protein
MVLDAFNILTAFALRYFTIESREGAWGQTCVDICDSSLYLTRLTSATVSDGKNREEKIGFGLGAI